MIEVNELVEFDGWTRDFCFDLGVEEASHAVEFLKGQINLSQYPSEKDLNFRAKIAQLEVPILRINTNDPKHLSGIRKFLLQSFMSFKIETPVPEKLIDNLVNILKGAQEVFAGDPTLVADTKIGLIKPLAGESEATRFIGQFNPNRNLIVINIDRLMLLKEDRTVYRESPQYRADPAEFHALVNMARIAEKQGRADDSKRYRKMITAVHAIMGN